MDKIQVIYWSQTGNTKEMADAIAQGIVEAGKEAEVLEVCDASVEALKDATAFALGCPAMGNEVLEEGEMEPFVEEVEKIASGKNIALFGSYGWGNGEWMQDWVERMKNAGANMVKADGLICNEAPDSEMIQECKALGKALASC